MLNAPFQLLTNYFPSDITDGKSDGKFKINLIDEPLPLICRTRSLVSLSPPKTPKTLIHQRRPSHPTSTPTPLPRLRGRRSSGGPRRLHPALRLTLSVCLSSLIVADGASPPTSSHRRRATTATGLKITDIQSFMVELGEGGLVAPSRKPLFAGKLRSNKRLCTRMARIT
ncbi:hypothetical protein PIB30_068933 [Stylosanthes scabra]|uniref:Uncharacterized protein n=1 Tax=Stylosanthes scabra TaxID=79078 RepID=A0ABU6TMS5_9FABA|nr:hypothetical protein [Stylosanthes scabra]